MGPLSRATESTLLRELEAVDGLKLTPEAPLAPLNTFRIGGPAALLAEVSSQQALSRLLAVIAEAEVPSVLLGLGSNLLVADEGIRGVVVRLKGEFEEVSFDGTSVRAGGGVALSRLVRKTLARGLVGLEALAGFPSTVGGAVVMNAGCYGTEIKDSLVWTDVAERDGECHRLAVEELGAAYRTTVLQRRGSVVIGALFRLRRGDTAAAEKRMKELNRRRWASLPSGRPMVGSIFRNPPGEVAGRLIDRCGLKERRCGDAQISPEHANVIVNLGAARARDVLELMKLAYSRVLDRFGVRLEPEVVLTGGLREEWQGFVAGSDQEPSAR
jgi:UDP-N-acetylmuramate dehydrogenase